MSKLRVLLLHNVVAPYRLPVFEEVGRHFDLEVMFCKTKTADRAWDASLDGYKFNRSVLPVFQVGPFFINPTLPWRLLTQRYDVYLVGDFPETAFATYVTIFAAKLRRKPVVLWSETVAHDINYYQGLATSASRPQQLVRNTLTSLIRIYRRILLKLPNQYLALSGLARDFLMGEGIDADKITTGIQVMPASQLAPPSTPKSESPYAKNRLILYLGYLKATKGIDQIIAAMKHLPDPNLRLAIVGTGPEEARLKQLAANDSRIHFYGYTQGSGKADFMSWADVLVLPTLADCWALVVNESLHYGTPVIITNIAGAAEVLADGRRGIIIPPRDLNALTAAIQKITSDADRRHSLRAAIAADHQDLTDPAVGAAPIVKSLNRAGGRP